MKQFARPYWLFLTVTLPLCLIMLYFIGVYGIIASLLEAEHLTYWVRFGSVLGVLIVTTTAYGLFLQYRKQSIPWTYSLLALPLYIVLIVAYFRSLTMLLPISIPGWMIPMDEIVVLPVGLIMPVLLHSLLLQVDHLTPVDKKPSLVMTTIGAVLVPACWYIQMRFIVPALQGKIGWDLYQHVQITVFVVLTVVFMFLVLRLTYLLTMRGLWEKSRNALLIRGVFALILPLLSLLVYNGVVASLFDQYAVRFQFLGDWSHPGYYALIVINGLVLMLPPAKQDALKLGIFTAKAFLYPFVVYFFIVLLPFLPIAVDVVVVGLGFLLLSPLILFFFHTRSLVEDWNSLREGYGLKVPVLAITIAFMAVPTGLTLSYLMDRHALNTMLTHVYEPDYSSNTLVDIDKGSLRRVLGNIKKAKNNRTLIFEKRKPYLTTYYQWLVLDNLTLSEKRLADLERIFFGSTQIPPRANRAPLAEERSSRLSDVKVTTVLSQDGDYYKTQIDLTLVNGAMNNAEYVTKFRLPAGIWIDDYYLMINGQKVPGILAEKKSALWIYQQTRNAQRDPGIIYYTSPNEIIMRVFPFAPEETRHTGFEIIHRAPVHFEIDGLPVDVESKQPIVSGTNKNTVRENFVFVSPAEKAELTKTTRTPYLHFIVDRSAKATPQLEDYIQRIDKFVTGSPMDGIDREGARITVAHYDSRTYDIDPNWKAKLRDSETGGGFFLQRAFKKALYRHYKQHSNRYPVFIVVSDHIDDAIFTKGMSDFEITMPEDNNFYVLDKELHLSARRFQAPSEEVAVVDALSVQPKPVLVWPNAQQPNAYVPDDGQVSLIIKDTDMDFRSVSLKDGSWDNGVDLYGMWMSSRLNPAHAGSKQYSIILNSFKTHLLTPLTAFLSPENEAQRQMLLKKQQRMLSSMRPLDIGEENQMDEPPLWLLGLILVILFGFKKFRGYKSVQIGRPAVIN